MALIGTGCSSSQNVKSDDAQPATGEQPQRATIWEFAPGDDGDLVLDCAGGSMNLIANSQTYPLREGELLAIPVSKPTEVDLECKVANGTFSTGSKCFDQGHLRALFLDGKAILGCYKGRFRQSFDAPPSVSRAGRR